MKKCIVPVAFVSVCAFMLSVSAAPAPSEYSMPAGYYGATVAGTTTAPMSTELPPEVSAAVQSAVQAAGVSNEIDSAARAQGLSDEELDDYAKKLIEGRDLGSATVSLVGVGAYTGLNQEYDSNYKMYKQTTMYDTGFYSSIPNGSTISEPVTLTFGEGQVFDSVRVTKDGTDIAYNPGDTIRENGAYVIYFDMQSSAVTSAMFSNRALFTFRIATAPNGTIDVYTPPMGYKISKVTYREDTSAVTGSSVDFANENYFIPTAEGIYSISMVGIEPNLQSRTMVLNRDTTPPEFELEGVEEGGTTKSKVSVKIKSKDTGVVELYLSNNKVDYSGEITQPGNYVVSVTDKAGNTARKSFSVLYTINSGSVVSMLVLMAGAAGSGVFVVIRGRKNLRVR